MTARQHSPTYVHQHLCRAMGRARHAVPEVVQHSLHALAGKGALCPSKDKRAAVALKQRGLLLLQGATGQLGRWGGVRWGVQGDLQGQERKSAPQGFPGGIYTKGEARPSLGPQKLTLTGGAQCPCSGNHAIGTMQWGPCTQWGPCRGDHAVGTMRWGPCSGDHAEGIMHTVGTMHTVRTMQWGPCTQ